MTLDKVSDAFCKWKQIGAVLLGTILSSFDFYKIINKTLIFVFYLNFLNWAGINLKETFDWLKHEIAALSLFPAGNFMFKVDNRNTRTRCEICFHTLF